MSQQKLKKGITFAAMMAYIRASMVEQMLPAAPYLLRFNISDYTYFTDYVRDRCLTKIMKEGLYEEFIGSCEDVKDYLLKQQGKLYENIDFWTVEKLEDLGSDPPGSNSPLSTDPGTFDERMWGLEGVDLHMQSGKEEIVGVVDSDGDPIKLDASVVTDKTISLYEQFMNLEKPEQKEAFLKEWKRIEQDKAKINFESGENAPKVTDSSLAVDEGKGGNKTPYMLSNYYGNVFPIGKRQLESQLEEESIWAEMGDFLMGLPFITINGVPLTPPEALRRALMLLCFKPDAFGAWGDALQSTSDQPTRSFDTGAVGFQAFAKPPMISGNDLLDALIVMETTAFIQKVKSLKEDPHEDWDWPLDFAYVFFKKLLPKPTPMGVILNHLQVGDTNHEESLIGKMMFPQKIMYAPVIDGEMPDGEWDDPNALSTNSAMTTENRLLNFPWKFKSWQGPHLSREEAKENVLQPYMDKATGAPVISATVGAGAVLGIRKDPAKQIYSDHFRQLRGGLSSILIKRQAGEIFAGTDEAKVVEWNKGYVEDKYNGGLQFHMKTGGFVLQLFAYTDSYLWERVDEETLETIETDGLRNLLYLFGNRSYNLKGHFNPHYWNACMKDFFAELEKKTDGTGLGFSHDFTNSDLEMFKNRMGAEYANVHMGLRLCWMVPSGMPYVYDSEKHESGKVWWTKPEYGDPDLIAAYKSISDDAKMSGMFKNDKCHAYVVTHKQHEVTWKHLNKETNSTVPELTDTITDKLAAEQVIREYAFCFPLAEVISDEPVVLDPENWNIMPEGLSLQRHPDNVISKLIKKMADDEDFRVLFEYIFPIKSIIPEIATIYGMEFFKPVADYMSVRKNYFGGVRATASAMIKAMGDDENYNTGNPPDPEDDLGQV